MASTGCICGVSAFPNMGTPNCTQEMLPMAFPILIPRWKADGSTRNSLDVSSATLGADIQALITTATVVDERLYPFPRVQNPTIPRTDTAYETTANGDKFKLAGEGGVYSFLFELYGSESVFQLQRELVKAGCIDIDMYIATTDGALWGTKTSLTSTALNGYMLSKETFDSFFNFPVPGARAKIMVSADVERAECIENSYVITSTEMVDTGGVSATSLLANVSGYQTLVDPTPSNTSIQTAVYMGFGTAGSQLPIKGLLQANFTINDDDASVQPAPIPQTAAPVESPDGTYTLTVGGGMTASNTITVSVIDAAGFDVADGSAVAS